MDKFSRLRLGLKSFFFGLSLEKHRLALTPSVNLTKVIVLELSGFSEG